MESQGKERLRKIKTEHPRAYERWTVEEETRLLKLRSDGLSVEAISEILQRQPGGIRSRLQRLEEESDSPSRMEASDGSEQPGGPALAQVGEVVFLPLAVSSMQGEAVCVAGLNVITRRWVRLVRRGKHALFSDDSTPFLGRRLMRVELGDHQARPQDVDPLGLHVEDRALVGSPAPIAEVSLSDKIVLLESMVESSLEQSLAERRTLFLVEPVTFRMIPRPGQSPKVAFSTAGTDTDALRGSSVLEQNKIGISSVGCPCTCLAWPQFAVEFGRVRSKNEIDRACPGARTFFALSLTGWPTSLPIERQRHYLLVAGVHVIGRDRVWL